MVQIETVLTRYTVANLSISSAYVPAVNYRIKKASRCWTPDLYIQTLKQDSSTHKTR